MNMKDTSTPVVVLKTEHYGGLGIMRSLGRLGISVYGVDRARHFPAMQSRFCRKSFRWDIDDAPFEDSAEFLLSLSKRFKKRAILIPTSDETTMLVAQCADVLKEGFMFPYQPAGLIRSLCHKKEMYFLARRHGIPIPDSYFPASRNEALQLSETLSYPLLLKRIDRRKLHLAGKAVLVHNAEQLMEKYDGMEDDGNPNIMIQKYIPGRDDCAWTFNGFFDKNSDCLVAFTGKKIRQYPIYAGMMSLGISRWNEMVASSAQEFMKAIGYHGIVDIDFRFDAQDERFKVLAVNPRIGATFRLFVGRNGMDVVRALYLALTDQQVSPTVPWENRKWIVEDNDLLSSYRYVRDRKLSFSGWIHSFRGINEAGYFAFDDPVPFFSMWGNHMRRLLARIVRRRRVHSQRKNIRSASDRKRKITIEIEQHVEQERVQV